MSTINQDEIVAKTQSEAVISPFSEFSIGSLLLRMGKITPQDAERIMQLHKERGLRFGEAAVSLGYITEADIQQVLAHQFDYPYLTATQDNVSRELFAAYQPFSAKAETLRSIRSQLILRWFSLGKKSLAITSVNVGDGVESFAANLAIVFAQLGENVLLIDADMRAPKQTDNFLLTETRGLSDILAGRADKNIICKIAGFQNLSVLPAGTLPPNPQELVSRPVFAKVLNEFAKEYDVILIDAPAFSQGADIQAIASTIGGVVMVAKQNATKAADMVAAAEFFNDNNIQTVGSVLTE